MTDTPPPEPAAAPPPIAPTPSAPTPPPAPAVAWESPARTDGPAPGVDYAPHGPRLVAYIFDGLIITAICGILVILASALLVSGTTIVNNKVTNIEAGASAGFVVLILIAIVFATLYFPWFWARGGQTLGMRPFSLRVVSDRDGSRIGWGTALLRLVGLWVAGAVLYLGFIWIFVDKRHRGWQDLIAGTVVIKRP